MRTRKDFYFMKPFIHDDFLLTNKDAVKLYHDFAEKLPIIDFHNHLSPKDITDNRGFNTISEAWLEGDHYKWRAMRAAGVDEYFITGKAPDEEKFNSWANTVPFTLRNPLYHWTHLELARYFGIYELLNDKTKTAIYKKSNEILHSGNNNIQDLLIRMKVEILCTTDDPIDNLECHKAMSGNQKLHMLPTFRPDKVLNVSNPLQYNKYLDKLGEVAGIEIGTYFQLIEALQKRHDFFHSMGCRLSDHGLDYIPYSQYSGSEIQSVFNKIRSGQFLSGEEILKFQTALLSELLIMNHEKGWVQQLHIGAIRNVNERVYESIGPDSGYDSIGEPELVRPLASLLNLLDKQGKLARTIGYNLNPKDNDLLITMLSNFNDGKMKGMMQYGAAWWFLDQKQGIERQINDLSSYGLLHLFAGMVTDSRSFLSFPRHEYFRRILCNILGEDLEKGIIPNDEQMLKQMIEAICYQNAKNYFNWNK